MVPTSTGSGTEPYRVTIRKIAELAGVSIATVSRALNGRGDVSRQTRQAVLHIAELHGYRPRRGEAPPGLQLNGVTPAGRQLTGLVGVTLPWSEPTYFAQILAGAAEALYRQDMRALLCPTRDEHDREVSLLEHLRHGQTDGAVLILPQESPAELRQLKDQGFPFVVADPLYELDESIPVVASSNTRGANQATAHLLQLGHQRIGVITGPADGLATRGRLQGYHAALAAAGIMPDPDLQVEGDFLMPSGQAGAERLLDLDDPPTAIFAFNDPMACGVVRTARARGLRVPEDLSVVGFDDTVEAQVAEPPLTTVRQPLAELGRLSVTLLLSLLHQQWAEPLRVELATRMVVRSSTGPVPPRRHKRGKPARL